MATRPRTPIFNFAQHAGPSSPPATPTTTSSFPFNFHNRRHGVQNFSRPLSTPHTSEIIPNGNGTTFSYNPFQPLDLELSPRSSSPASSTPSSEAGVDSPRPRSRSSSPGAHTPSSPPRLNVRTRVVAEGNFTLEEVDDEDYDINSGASSPLRPHQYEDAESEHARSTRGTSPNRELDPRILHGMQHMNCAQEEEDNRDLWYERQLEMKRRKRRSSSSVQKRSLAQSIGSDTDDEDLQPVFEDANEAGSTARRLRRKMAGERTSLIFDDPPPRIEEQEEPESCEEVVSIEDDEGHTQGVDRNLPYYVMELDSDED